MTASQGPALTFHQSVSYDRLDMDNYSLDWSTRPTVQKTYPGRPRVELDRRFGFPPVSPARCLRRPGRCCRESPAGPGAPIPGPVLGLRGHGQVRASGRGVLFPDRALGRGLVPGGAVPAPGTRPGRGMQPGAWTVPLPQPGPRPDPAPAGPVRNRGDRFFPDRHHLPLGLEVPGPGLAVLLPGHRPRNREPGPGPGGRGVCSMAYPCSWRSRGGRLFGVGPGPGDGPPGRGPGRPAKPGRAGPG